MIARTTESGESSPVNSILNESIDMTSPGHTTTNTSVANGGESPNSASSTTSESDDDYDLICVGFGPASLSIAIALHDKGLGESTRVLFVEKQSSFAWHSGMLLSGSRMQISFIKDLASLRNPRSHFTFINYLHLQNRLVTFTNLGTFLPLRQEYNDYMTWCAKHFDDQVKYGETVSAVDPVAFDGDAVKKFEVHSVDAHGVPHIRTAKHVVVAVGGKPNIPSVFPESSRRVIHSSQYAYTIDKILTDKAAPYNVAVVGGGQSAAEIFADLHSRYPNCNTRLLIKAQALKPSDDSPFVNEIFNPEKVDEVFSLPADVRSKALYEDKATNYGVVRLELLERLYEDFYTMRLKNADEETWPHRIVPLTDIIRVKEQGEKLGLTTRNIRTGAECYTEYDAVIVATGYVRDVYKTILQNTKHLLAQDASGVEYWNVGRNYKLEYAPGRIDTDAGVWLQGCCEATHGLSDSLLSILAVRGGDMVDTIFGDNSQYKPSEVPADFMPRTVPKHTRSDSYSTITPKEISFSTADKASKASKKETQSAWKNLSRRISGRK